MRKMLCGCVILFLLTITRSGHAQEGLPWPGGAPSAELFKLLQDINRDYGPDGVTLVSWLLDSAIRSGSVLTASVKVDGVQMHHEEKFLVFQVDTGIIFNSNTLDQNSRLTKLWEGILARTFSHLETLRVPADGVAIHLLYHAKAFPEREDISEQIDEPGPVEEAQFFFLTDQVRAFLSKNLSAQALLAQSQILVNDSPVTLILPEGAQHTDITTSNHAARHL